MANATINNYANIFFVEHRVPQTDVVCIFIAGRPQTRVGPHGLFVYLANELAANGISSIRFDNSGWGDSPKKRLDYHDSWQDIKEVIKYCKNQNSNSKIVLLGLCDGATAAILSLPHCKNIDGLILLNPYIENDSAESGAKISDYYLPQLKNIKNYFRLLKTPVELPKKIFEFVVHWKNARSCDSHIASQNIIKLLQNNKLPTTFIFSSNDITASQAKIQLKSWLSTNPKNIKVKNIEQADHTFSKPLNKNDLFNLIKNSNCLNSLLNK